MGLGLPEIILVTRLQREGYFHSRRSVVEIGAQQMSNTLLRQPQILRDCAAAFGAEDRTFQPAGKNRMVHGEVEELTADAPYAREFWEGLGFRYNSIDLDGSPGAIPLDLNFDPVPEELRKSASLVTNCGTTEHLANQLNAFKVIHDLTAEGGVMIHVLPAQGYLTHGLVNYNPKFFWSLSAANGYKWLHFDLDRSDVKYTLPQDIIGELSKFDPNAGARHKSSTFSDSGIYVAMQKLYDMDFVPPIDVPNDAETDNPVMRERYWTIFDRPRFHKMIDEIEKERAARRG